MTGIERIASYKARVKSLPLGNKPQANHEDWRFSPSGLLEDLGFLMDACGKTTLAGEHISKLKELSEEHIHAVMDVVESTPWESLLPFLQIMDTHLCCSRVISVSGNQETPIIVDLTDRAEGFLPAPLMILFEEGSKGRVILKTTGNCPMVESLRIIALANSEGFIDILEKTSATWAGFEQITLLEGAKLTHTFLSLGHGMKRRDTTINLKGKGSVCHANSAYLSRFSDYKELLIRQRHTGKHTISNVLEKGVVADNAYNVLNGIIQVRPDASFSEAYLTNNNLLLNDGVRSHSIPRLEIEENEVKSSHSSTASLLDPIQIFYMKSRGISESEARSILTESFLEEALKEADESLVAELTGVFA